MRTEALGEVAHDTRGVVPTGRSDLRRISLNPRHWRHARWMLCFGSVVLGLSGLAALLGNVAVSDGADVSVLGLDLTPVLSLIIFVLGVAAGVSMLRRRLALVFTAVVAAASLAMVIISAVAAVREAVGPLGFTAADTLLYAALFCYHLAIGMWLIPDQIEGPAWVRHRGSSAHKDNDAPSGSDS